MQCWAHNNCYNACSRKGKYELKTLTTTLKPRVGLFLLWMSFLFGVVLARSEQAEWLNHTFCQHRRVSLICTQRSFFLRKKKDLTTTAVWEMHHTQTAVMDTLYYIMLNPYTVWPLREPPAGTLWHQSDRLTSPYFVFPPCSLNVRRWIWPQNLASFKSTRLIKNLVLSHLPCYRFIRSFFPRDTSSSGVELLRGESVMT